MVNWLVRILLVVITIVVAVLTITALPTLDDHHMAGTRLMIHMMAGGSLVVAMPVFALLFLSRAISPQRSAILQRWGFWIMVLAATVSIGSVLMCMLPVLSTEQMHQWMVIHGYAGFTTGAALLLLGLGCLQWRRISATRSSTAG